MKEKVGKVRQKVKKFKESRQKRKAKRRGMTVEEYKQHMVNLQRKEAEERRAFEEWKIEEKYRRKREDGMLAGPGLGSKLLRGIKEMSVRAAENLEAQMGTGPKKTGKKRKKSRMAITFESPEDYAEYIRTLTDQPSQNRKTRRRNGRR